MAACACARVGRPGNCLVVGLVTVGAGKAAAVRTVSRAGVRVSMHRPATGYCGARRWSVTRLTGARGDEVSTALAGRPRSVMAGDAAGYDSEMADTFCR